MTAAKAIQEQVRILALQIGVRPAARQLGLNEDTVCSWASRYDWKVPTVTNGAPPSIASTMQATHVADSVASELAENERETRLSLARSARRMAKDAELATLRNSGEVKNVAQTAAIVHRWDQKQQQSNVMVNIALLGVEPSEVLVEGHTVADTDSA